MEDKLLVIKPVKEKYPLEYLVDYQGVAFLYNREKFIYLGVPLELYEKLKSQGCYFTSDGERVFFHHPNKKVSGELAVCENILPQYVAEVAKIDRYFEAYVRKRRGFRSFDDFVKHLVNEFKKLPVVTAQNMEEFIRFAEKYPFLDVELVPNNNGGYGIIIRKDSLVKYEEKFKVLAHEEDHIYTR